MSEEFDKEAEREKLREKFDKDEEKRSATQRMSELLLGGATMTDQHCGRCGDPLFREGGGTFCPTCSTDEEGAETPQQQAETGGSPAESPAEADVRSEQSGQPPAGAASTNTVNGAEEAESFSQLPDDAEVVRRADEEEPERAKPQAGQSRTEQPQAEPMERRPQQPGSGDAADPRAELERAVTETARKASAATDPRTAREWLEASKEAAEALAALER